MDSPQQQPVVPSTLEAGTETPHIHTEAITAEPSTPRPSTPRRIFFGPFGLRAGWSLLIYFVLLAALVFGIRLTHDAITHKGHFAPKTHASAAIPAAPTPPRQNASAPETMKSLIPREGIVFALFFFVSWIMARIERRRLAVFGLGGTHSLSRFFTGALWGLLAMALLIASLRIFGFLHFDAQLDHGRSILFWALLQLFAFLLVGLLEEYVFRGYIQFTLTRGFVGLGRRIAPAHPRAAAFWIASIITSAIFLFAHTHNSGENWFGLVTVFLAGLLLVIALWRTGSLWWAIGFHTTWDWSQSFLYGVPDSGGLMQGRLFSTHAAGNPLLSGGTVGPEGSVLVVVPLVLVILVLLFLTRRSPQPPLETTAPPTHHLEAA